MRVCKKCGTEISEDEFCAIGRRYECRKCIAIRHRIRRLNNLETARAADRQRYVVNSEKAKAYARAYYQANREKMNAEGRARYYADWEKSKAISRAYAKAHPGKWRTAQLKRVYGLTELEYQALLKSQNGGCAVCGGTDRLGVDHDHTTMKNRGILCPGCNMAFGLVKETVMTLQNLIRYKRRHSV